MILPCLPPITAAHATVFLRAKLVPFICVYALIPLLFLYGFRMAFPDMTTTFFVTGFLVNTAFMCTFYPMAFEGYGRMHTDGQYTAILAAAVPLQRILVEDILWFAIRGMLAAMVMAVVALPLTMPVENGWTFLAALPFMAVTSICAAVFGVLVCAICTSMDQVTYSETIVAAIFVFSGIFVDIGLFPPFIQHAMWLSPLYHGVEGVRAIMGGAALSLPLLAAHGAALVVMTVLLFVTSHKLLYRRLLA